MLCSTDRVVVSGDASGNRLHARWPFAPCWRLQARTPGACCGKFGMREWDMRRIADDSLQGLENRCVEPWCWTRVLGRTCARALEDLLQRSCCYMVSHGLCGPTSRSLLPPWGYRSSVLRSHTSRRTTSALVSHHVPWLVCFRLLCSTPEGAVAPQHTRGTWRQRTLSRTRYGHG